MAIELEALVEPSRTALITNECQRGVMGDLSPLPELAEAAAGTVTSNIAKLVWGARAANVPVIHCTAERRDDGLGANTNARLFRYMARAPLKLTPGSAAAEIIKEIPVTESDLVMPRLHGLSPFQGTELDAVLRNLGVQTIVAAGVSLNVAIPNLTFDAVNASYQVVIPCDACAGFPREYAQAMFENTLNAISTLTNTQDILSLWR